MSKNVNRFDYVRLRNGPHLQMADDFIALTTRHPVEELLLDPLLTRYRQAVEAERRHFDVVRTSVRRPELAAADALRDSLYCGFRAVVRGCGHHYDPNRQAAARRLMIVLRSYRYLVPLPLDDKTALMTALHEELEKPGNLRDVQLLGLEEWLEKLADANNRYRELSQRRLDELAGYSGGELRKARLETDARFRTVLNYLDTKMDADPSAPLVRFVDDVNAITRHYEHIALQEQGIREARKEKEEQPVVEE